jgi:hypothetical protein
MKLFGLLGLFVSAAIVLSGCGVYMARFDPVALEKATSLKVDQACEYAGSKPKNRFTAKPLGDFKRPAAKPAGRFYETLAGEGPVDCPIHRGGQTFD